MRKLSLFLVVALVATMFTFIAMPASAAGEGIEFKFDQAAVGSSYDYTLTVVAKTGLNVALFTIAYDNDEFLLVDKAGTALSADDAQAASLPFNTVLNDTKFWIKTLVYGTTEGTVNSSSGVLFTRKSGAVYDLAKVSFNNGSGNNGATISAGDLLKFYIKRKGTSNTSPAGLFKLVATDATKVPAGFGIDIPTLNTNLSSTGATFGVKTYGSSIQYGSNTTGCKLGADAVPAYFVTADQITWTDNVVSVVNRTVTFRAAGFADITRTVVDGAALTDIPAVPEKSGYTGVWEITSFPSVTSDMTVNAVYTLIPPAANTITANITGKGKVFIDTVPYAGKVTLAEGVSAAAIKIIPNLGYTVETATLTGVTGNIVAPAGGTYNATISGDATLAVTFVPVAETIGANKPLPSQKIFKETKDVGGVLKPANTTFAAAPTSGIVECGIYLKKDGADYTKFGGPYFKSNNTNVNGQYGIEFVGFESGSYTATPYVRYTSATETPTLAGTSVTFVVE